MNRKRLIQYFFSVGLAVGLWFLPVTVLWAASTVTLPADATVLQKITITPTVGLNAGRIERPSSGPLIQFVMQFNGNLSTFGGSGAGGAFIDGQQPGLFTLSGSPNSTYNISRTNGSCTGTTNITFFSITLEKVSGTFSSTGSDTFGVGFTVNLLPTSTSTTGAACTYTLDVDY